MDNVIDLTAGWEFAKAEWLSEPPTYIHYPGWLPATVPGHVQLDLVANGVIKHPFEGIAEAGCQWVDEADWCYRNRFDWRPSGKSQILYFEGLDTVCTIFLNGDEIGRSDNMFLPVEIDVTSRLREGENELRVDFQSAVRVGRERRAAYFEREGIPADVKNFDERAFVRKAQYMFGWDWGPRLVSCGIWKPVRLVDGDFTTESLRTTSVTEAKTSQAQLRREPDEFGESFEFVVDGKPIWAMGANWIPVHSFPSQPEKVAKLIEDCALMGFNMLRVWGGGLYESDEFYDLCDEHGILVWQDFPFACSYYPDDDAFVENIREEATYHVKRLRHRKCLALWCGNNENLTMWEGKWGGADRNPSRFHGERIWNEVLRDVVAEHDPGRAYIPTSPIGSPPGVVDCNAGGYGDSHYWDVWHGRGDWVHYADSTARFSSEFGFPSSCGMKAWSRVLEHSTPPLKGREPDEQVIRAHDKTGRPFEYLRDLITRHYPEPKNLDEWVYFSQLNQRDAMRFAVEYYRGSEFCKGTLIWQLNDCWPVQSWSLIDSEGEWKAVAHEMQRLYRKCLGRLKIADDKAEYWIANDTSESETDFAAFEVFDSLSGELLYTSGQLEDVVVPPRSKVLHLTHDLRPYDKQQVILSIYSFSGPAAYTLCEPKKLKLATPKIRAYIEGNEVEVSPDVPVMDLFIWDPTGGATFADNYCSFAMPTSLTNGFTGRIGALRGRSWAGEHEIEIVDKPLR